MLVGGDRLRQAPHGPLPFTLVNHYGPTRYSVVATVAEIPSVDGSDEGREFAPPIGRPIANTQVYVVDAAGELVPPRIPGELTIAGAGLASGYLGRDALTAERFVPNPFAVNGRPHTGGANRQLMYRTGDRVRWRHDGQLEFIGRRDTQVSIRGFRVEIAEIEGVLARHPAVHAVVVNARADQHGDTRLTAYIVRSEEDRRRDEQARRDRVNQWQSLYDTTYGGSAAADPTFDITGWHSSYTGLPIPPDEMREWVEATVERLRRRQPRRILEIGVGTGLLLHRLAPHCDEYVGVDFSDVVLAQVRDHVRTAGLTNVRLLRAAADELDVLGDERFDAVVLNSIASVTFPEPSISAGSLTGRCRGFCQGASSSSVTFEACRCSVPSTCPWSCIAPPLRCRCRSSSTASEPQRYAKRSCWWRRSSSPRAPATRG